MNDYGWSTDTSQRERCNVVLQLYVLRATVSPLRCAAPRRGAGQTRRRPKAFALPHRHGFWNTAAFSWGCLSFSVQGQIPLCSEGWVCRMRLNIFGSRLIVNWPQFPANHAMRSDVVVLVQVRSLLCRLR